MKRIQQGFTLIELMIVVAIVGILAAIALPAYQDYVVRSKMSETMAAIAACKTSVAEYTSTKGTVPATTVLSGCSTVPSQYLASLTAVSGVITAVSKSTGGSSECTLTLTPTGVTAGGGIASWNGSYTGCPAKYVPSSFRG